MTPSKILPFGLILLCCVYIIKANSMKPELIKACADQESISFEEANALRAKTPLTNDKMKCYVKCLLDKSGYIDSAGNLNMDFIKKDNDDIKDAAVREKLLKCLEGVKKVETCQDVDPVRVCYIDTE